MCLKELRHDRFTTSWMALREYDQQLFTKALWVIDTSLCYG
jgi:hypothetical protein